MTDILLMLFYTLPPLFFILAFALVAVLWERKFAGAVQNRFGPNRVGYNGYLQTIADILKLLQKENIVSDDADKKTFHLAPIIVFLASYAAFAVVPFSSAYVGASIDFGILFILAISGFSVVGIMLGGWSSGNKYSILGAMRSAAQIISYEVPVVLVIITVYSVTNSFDLVQLSEQQTSEFYNWYIFGGPELEWKKFVLIPFMIVSALLLFIGFLAEVNRTPFDLPEAESELVAGFHTEYTGIRFAFFFLAEYANMFLVSSLISVMFLGGYQSPFGYVGNLIGFPQFIPFEQFFWFLIKGLFIVYMQMWLRWTLPRLRLDQLMTLCWKYLIPISFFIFVFVSIIELL